MNKAARDLAEWDAEIEADFRRAVAASKAAGRSKRRHRLIGCPVGFLTDICRLTEGRAAVIVALCTTGAPMSVRARRSLCRRPSWQN
jgi:hypothetical protein